MSLEISTRGLYMTYPNLYLSMSKINMYMYCEVYLPVHFYELLLLYMHELPHNSELHTQYTHAGNLT